MTTPLREREVSISAEARPSEARLMPDGHVSSDQDDIARSLDIMNNVSGGSASAPRPSAGRRLSVLEELKEGLVHDARRLSVVRKEAPKGNIDCLTGLRGVCALVVVFSHTGDSNKKRLEKAVPDVLLCCGSDAVSLFFALSGFVMAYSYEKCGGFEKAGCRWTFWLKRFARVMPLYWLCLLTSIPFLVECINHVYGKWCTDAYHVASLVETPFGLQSLMPINSRWNFVAWSLSVEVVAYIVFPFLTRRQWLLWVMLAVMIPIGLAVNALGWVHTYFWSPVRATEFVVAAMLTREVCKRGIHIKHANWIGLSLLCTFLWTTYIDEKYGFGIIPHEIGRFTFKLLGSRAWVVVMALAQNPSCLVARLLATKPLVLLGDLSFASYMLHIQFIALFKQLKFKSVWAETYTLVPTVLIVSLLVHIYFEQFFYGRVLKWGKSKLGAKRACTCKGAPLRLVGGAVQRENFLFRVRAADDNNSTTAYGHVPQMSIVPPTITEKGHDDHHSHSLDDDDEDESEASDGNP